MPNKHLNPSRFARRPAVNAAFANLIGQQFRVVYRNKLDNTLRVFIGGLTYAEASAVMSKWADPKQPFFYMGPEATIEKCDGTPDGAVLPGCSA